tara:strand:+ start:57 stop:1133 length:1077 start_codon:yes stop_codon:yes gene_type:complete
MSDQNYQVNVVLSGAQETSVVVGGQPSVNVSVGGDSSTSVTQGEGSTSVLSTDPVAHPTVGFVGVQGPPSSLVFAKGEDGQIQYNRLGYISGANNFFFYPETDNLHLSGGLLSLAGGKFQITGLAVDTGAFLIREPGNDKNLFKIDTVNKKISMSNSSSSEYYVGIGTGNAEEKLHIAGGNLRVDGNIVLGGNIIPTQSGVYNLGSPTAPFKELYIQGDSIHFVNTQSKISANQEGFSFTTQESDGTQKVVFEVSNEGIHGDGSLLTGVPYTGMKDAGAYLSFSVPDKSESMIVDYGKELNYDPQVLCDLVPPAGKNEIYFTSVHNIERTGCNVFFSHKISGNGYILNCHVGPRNPLF